MKSRCGETTRGHREHVDGVVPADLEGTQQRGGGTRDLPRAAVLDVEQQKRGGDENQACGRAGEVDCGREEAVFFFN